jgi:hypothetical protein
MSEWVTERLPTVEDALHYCVLLWDEDDGVLVWSYDAVNEGQPWQPILKPNPYVKPKPKESRDGYDQAQTILD